MMKLTKLLPKIFRPSSLVERCRERRSILFYSSATAAPFDEVELRPEPSQRQLEEKDASEQRIVLSKLPPWVPEAAINEVELKQHVGAHHVGFDASTWSKGEKYTVSELKAIVKKANQEANDIVAFEAMEQLIVSTSDGSNGVPLRLVEESVKAYQQSGNASKIKDLVLYLEKHGKKPSASMYVRAISAECDDGNVYYAKQMMASMRKAGYSPNQKCCADLMLLLALRGGKNEVKKMYDAYCHDFSTFSSPEATTKMISSFGICGEPELSFEIYGKFLSDGGHNTHDIVSNVLNACILNKRWKVASKLISNLLDSGFLISPRLCERILVAITRMGDPDLMERMICALPEEQKLSSTVKCVVLFNEGKFDEMMALFSDVTLDGKGFMRRYAYTINELIITLSERKEHARAVELANLAMKKGMKIRKVEVTKCLATSFDSIEDEKGLQALVQAQDPRVMLNIYFAIRNGYLFGRTCSYMKRTQRQFYSKESRMILDMLREDLSSTDLCFVVHYALKQLSESGEDLFIRDYINGMLCCTKAKRFDRARTIFSLALEGKTALDNEFWKVATALYLQSPKSMPNYEEVLKKKTYPENPELYFSFLNRCGRSESVIANWRNILDLPNNALDLVYDQVLEATSKLKDTKTMMSILKDAADQNIALNAKSIIIAVKCMVDDGDVTAASNFAQFVEDTYNTKIPHQALTLIALEFCNQNDTKQALDYCMRLMEVDGAMFSQAFRSCMELCHRTGDIDRALTLFKAYETTYSSFLVDLPKKRSQFKAVKTFYAACSKMGDLFEKNELYEQAIILRQRLVVIEGLESVLRNSGLKEGEKLNESFEE